MKAITRRVIRLEERFGPPVETEFSRQLAARLKAGLRRLAESLGQSADTQALPPPSHIGNRRLGIVERLNAGRERVRLRAIQEEERRNSSAVAPDQGH